MSVLMLMIVADLGKPSAVISNDYRRLDNDYAGSGREVASVEVPM